MHPRCRPWWLLLLLLAIPLPAQDLDALQRLAAGSAADRETLLLFLEDARVADASVWRSLLAAASTDGERAAVVRGMSRVREPEQKVLLPEVIAAGGDDYSLDYSWAVAQWIGELGTIDDLAANMARLAAAPLAFTIGQVLTLPSDDALRRAMLARFDAESEASGEVDDRGRLADGVVAALVHGARLKEAAFQGLALEILAQEKPALARERAAVYYLYRHSVPVPAERRDLVAGRLKHEDPETAGFAAWALARAEGSGESEAARITAAFLDGGEAVTQVDRLRALAFLPPRPALPALLEATKSEVPALRRTAWETVRSVARKLADDDRQGFARFATAVVLGDPSADVRRAAIESLARLDRDRFLAALPAVRLDPSPRLRGGAAVGLGELRFDAVVATWSRRFLRDPDVRVRARVLEGRRRAAARGGEVLRPGVLPRWLALFAEDVALDRGRQLKLRLGRLRPEVTSDPVLVSLACQQLAALKRSPEVSLHFGYGIYCTELLKAALPLIPDHEAELLQGVVDLAAEIEGEEGRNLLVRFLTAPEISIRKRAAERLVARGETVQARRPMSPDEQDAWILRCRKRQAASSEAGPSVLKLETELGTVGIRLFRREAPGTVEFLERLAGDGFFDGLSFQRVVPAFVAQGGCPRGDSWGGSGRTIRCEITARTYRPGVVGMALAGKDTGGCQWFIAQRRVPQLDGGYTIFGEVSEGRDLIARLESGARILTARVVRSSPTRSPR